ncbi:oligosaccharide flippase family protein [Arthrobacter sp. PM3]|uniref:oligosaccharide flippase family protein n=1 Tax=Arthrobacter sp. PM3 TaxID=2017685 RepID=UPI000E102F27|nr:oligosaccharide flippase family protein [Arthrobacter sp. PM3]AXJ09292.1 polysaccharide biosynthesis protein [Arthrobacter sp. PM3]
MKTAVAAPGATNAFAWSLLNTALSRLGTMAIGILLARLLGPESFGTFAIALVALMAILSFNELGVSLAIVRWPGDPREIAPTVNTISVVGSAVFCCGAFFAAPLFTAAMGDPEATDVIRVLIASVFINGIVASPAALLQRGFREKTRLLVDQVNVWIGAVLSVLLAIAGMGAMALAVGRVAGSLISGVVFLAASPLPYRFGLDRSLVGPLLRFGMPLAGTSLIFFAVSYADQLTVGTILGSTALGFYALAFNLSNWPVSIVAQPLRRVAPASFSTLQHDRPAMNAALTSIIALLASAALPPVFFLVGGAVPMVNFIYGQAWLPAASALSWLAVAAISKVFCDLAYDFLVVLGKSGTVLMIQAASLLVLVPALVAGATWFGLAGIAAAQAFVACCVVLPLYLWQLQKSGIRLHPLARKMLLPLMTAVITGLLAWAAASMIPDPFLALIAGGVAALVGAAILVRGQADQFRLLRTIGRPAPKEVPA